MKAEAQACPPRCLGLCTAVGHILSHNVTVNAASCSCRISRNNTWEGLWAHPLWYTVTAVIL